MVCVCLGMCVQLVVVRFKPTLNPYISSQFKLGICIGPEEIQILG